MSVGGTSASSPSFAGLMALVNQKTAARQGNANPNFYGLATKQTSGGAAIFHDTTTGNNSVPGVTGFTASAGYDLATGLGSVDAAQMVSHWKDLTTPSPSLTLSGAQSALTLAPGASAQVKFSSAVAGGFNSAVALSVNGVPAGMTAALSAAKLAAPGSGDVILTLTTAKTIAYGTYTLSVAAQGGSLTSTASLSVSVQATGTFSFGTTSNYLSVGQGYTGTLNVLVTPVSGFTSPISITIPGLPAGVAASAAVTPTGTAAITVPLPISVANTAPVGVYSLLVSATGGGQTKTFPLQLTVTGASGCTLYSNQASITLQAGASLNFQVGCNAVQGGFKSVLNLSMTSNKPDGLVIQQLNMQTVPGSTPATFAITSANTAAPGTYTVQIKATTPTGFNASISIPLKVTAPNTILVTSSQNSVTLVQGGTTSVQITTRHSGTFSGPVTLVAAGLPAGVTAKLSASQFPAPGDGTATITLTASTSAVPGSSYYFVVAALSGSTTGGVPIGIVINRR